MNSPIALFVYNRPAHAKEAIESLIANKEFSDSIFYIFCDGEKGSFDRDAVGETRKVVKSYLLSNAIVIERERNLGLAKSIIDGVTMLCEKHGKSIIVEDDLKVSPDFLEYMNAALLRYENDDAVMQIAGYSFPTAIDANYDAYFLPIISSWGWATWKNSWKYFDPDCKKFNELKYNKDLKIKFNADNSYPYYSMLLSQLSGKIDSWAIRWYLSVFFRNGLILYPRISLVHNNGFDGSGTHCKHNSLFAAKNPINNFNVIKYPDVYVDEINYKNVKTLLSKNQSTFMKILNYLVTRIKLRRSTEDEVQNS